MWGSLQDLPAARCFRCASLSPARLDKSPLCKTQMPLEASSAEMLREGLLCRAASLHYKVLFSSRQAYLGQAAAEKWFTLGLNIQT